MDVLSGRDLWSTDKAVFYLDRCQVDTPPWVVDHVWNLVRGRRDHVGKVVDFGAGDGRFARVGSYDQYIGYEIDARRLQSGALPKHASLLNKCAFSDSITDADLCIGNPPYVRNQDLPTEWRQQAVATIKARTGIEISGLANAWQYFAFLALASTRDDGIVALVIPYEWVSRPSARSLREFIIANGWEVAVHRLPDNAFPRVLTTASISLIDKRSRSGSWRYFEFFDKTTYKALESPSGGLSGVLAYSGNVDGRLIGVFVKRGLSPGTQNVLVLTEAERVHHGLRIGPDVVPCVTSLRPLGLEAKSLTQSRFRTFFRDAGEKCWLIRTDRALSHRLDAYLSNVPLQARQTATCQYRDEWWKFTMPTRPSAIVAVGFRGARPKAVVNSISAAAVGGVAGIYGLSERAAWHLVRSVHTADFGGQIVAHSKGFQKLEIGQWNTYIASIFQNQLAASS